MTRLPVAWRDGTLFYALAVLLLAMSATGLQVDATMPVHDTLVVLDVSESMNVRDADAARPAMSRMDLAKAAAAEAMAALGCGSRVALGLFAGDDVLVLHEPLEVCEHFAAMTQVVDRLSTRARWIGDSRVETALRAALREAAARRLNLVFITDGDDMPHRAAPRITDLERLRGKARGLVMAVGGEVPMPVPRLDEHGEVAGYWTSRDAAREGFYPQHTATVTALEGNDGDAPAAFDDVTEHVSAARPAYLQTLARAAGLDALPLRKPGDAARAAGAVALQRQERVRTDLVRLWCLLAAAAALAGWFAPLSDPGRLERASGVPPKP